jgi:hypothetical protein
MILSSHGLIASQITQFVGLLDTYSGAAAAYSLRLLRSAYTGSAIEVRRTNNDVADIGFTSTGELDTAALLAFTGTGALDNGFVTKWYDQSGNGRDATQATAINQPQIVSSGSVITKNGKPSIEFYGNDWLANSTNGVLRLDLRTHFYVIEETTSTDFAAIVSYSPLSGNDNNNFFAGNVNLGNGTSIGNTAMNLATSTPFISGSKPTPYRLISSYCDSSNGYIQANNGTFSSAAHGYPLNRFQTGLIHIGVRFLASPNTTYAHKGIMQELIMYNGDSQNSNISDINSNINDFYSIY